MKKGDLMVRIVSDTSTLYSTAEAQRAGFDVTPLSVTVAGKNYLELDEISSETFVGMLREGEIPVTSQPAVGGVHELYEKYPDDEIVNVTMALGLSGTYTGAVAAASMCRNPERIHVINSRTLCGPHRYLVEKAVQWAKEGHSVETILERLEKKMETAKSYLLPVDYDYLRRGGRLSGLVSHVGKLAGLCPVMTQTEDGTRITSAGIGRGFSHAIRHVQKAIKGIGTGTGWRIYISHADALGQAEKALQTLRAAIPDASYEILPLSPAFITQGGPGCIAVQIIES